MFLFLVFIILSYVCGFFFNLGDNIMTLEKITRNVSLCNLFRGFFRRTAANGIICSNHYNLFCMNSDKNIIKCFMFLRYLSKIFYHVLMENESFFLLVIEYNASHETDTVVKLSVLIVAVAPVEYCYLVHSNHAAFEEGSLNRLIFSKILSNWLRKASFWYKNSHFTTLLFKCLSFVFVSSCYLFFFIILLLLMFCFRV